MADRKCRQSPADVCIDIHRPSPGADWRPVTGVFRSPISKAVTAFITGKHRQGTGASVITGN